MTITINRNSAGWIIAAILGTVLLASGFEAGTEKTGVIDMQKVVTESEVGKASQSKLDGELARRKSLIEFVQTYKVLTTEQAEKLLSLTLKDVPTDADRKEIDGIKQAVIEADKKRNDLIGKSAPTDQDRLALQDYNNRAQTMEQVMQHWQADFQRDLDTMQDKVRADVVSKAKEAVRESAKEQGFSVVFESNVAVYGANDLTEAAIKKLNSKKS